MVFYFIRFLIMEVFSCSDFNVAFQEKFERRTEDAIFSLTKRVQKLEDEIIRDRDRTQSAIQVH